MRRHPITPQDVIGHYLAIRHPGAFDASPKSILSLS